MTKSWCLMALLFVTLFRASAGASDFEFPPPATAEDSETPEIMRDLAVRLIPVYQKPDPDRYLANLSALQMAARDYTSAYVSRQSLRERRRSADAAPPVSRDV